MVLFPRADQCGAHRDIHTRRDSMPELPEVETVRRILDAGIVGESIRDVSIGDFPAVLAATLDGIDPAQTLMGRTFTETARRGKYLVLNLDAGWHLIVHLRMTGRLLLLPAGAPAVRFEHLAIRLGNDMDIRFGDQRKFGRLVLATTNDVDRLDRKLGPEPFAAEINATSLSRSLARRPGKIKNALLDQRLIAGLGNIYVDESLYRSRIHPERASNSLTIEEVKRVIRAIRHVLNGAIERQGTTFSSFENPYGEQGTNAGFLRVYGRSGGGLCFRCGAALQRIVVGGRGTTFCPRCQVIGTPPIDQVPEHDDDTSFVLLQDGIDR
jgi:formamidopyrimidine-DNA glycosylase